MRFAFAGSPQLGAWVLGDLLERSRVPTLVVSQPDRPAGRGRQCTPPPVVEAARSHGLPVHQTGNVSSEESIAEIRDSGAEVLVVAAFGQILRPALLDALLCLNVHASLLPAYRGAAPINRALMEGAEETGVSIMRMAPGLDEGPWALKLRRSISLWDDAGSLSRSLALLGALGLDQVLTGLEDKTVSWTEQSGEATYAHKLTPADRLLDFGRSVRACHDQVRGLAPDVGCEVEAAGLRLKIWRTWPWESRGGRQAQETAGGMAAKANTLPEGALPALPDPASAGPGAVFPAGDRLFAACTGGWLELLLVQPAGKRPMTGAELLRGYGRRLGQRLSSLEAG